MTYLLQLNSLRLYGISPTGCTVLLTFRKRQKGRLSGSSGSSVLLILFLQLLGTGSSHRNPQSLVTSNLAPTTRIRNYGRGRENGRTQFLVAPSCSF